MDKDGLRPLKDIEVVQDEEGEVARYERLQATKQSAVKTSKTDEEEEKSEEDEDEAIKRQMAEAKDRIAQKKLELQLKMNQARKLNNRAVVEEQERLTEGVAFERKKLKDEMWKEKRSV